MTDVSGSEARSGHEYLFAFWHEVEPAVEAELNLYLDFDHVPDRLSCDGWGTAERYVRSSVPVGGSASPKLMTYLYLHTLRSAEDATSSARDAFAVGSPWSRWQGEFRKGTAVAPSVSLRRTWRLVAEESEPAGLTMPSPRVLFAWLHGPNPVVPMPIALTGVLGCARYTSAGVHDGRFGPGESTFDLIELAAPEVVIVEPFARWLAEAAKSNLAHLEAAVYVQRPSPWLVRPVSGGAHGWWP